MKTIKLSILCIFFSCSVFAETIEFNADSMSGTVNDANSFTSLVGNAFVKTNSIELDADLIEIKGTNYRTINATGTITGTYSEAGFIFSCDSLTYDRELKVAILKGNVTMHDTENDVDLSSEFIEYNQNTEIANIQIKVKIIQGESTCTSSFAVYRKNEQILELNGSPKITQKEDVFKAHEIMFNLDTEEITLIGKVHGTVTDDGEKKED